MHDVGQRNDCLEVEKCRGSEDLQKTILYSTWDELSDQSPFPPANADGPFAWLPGATTCLSTLFTGLRFPIPEFRIWYQSALTSSHQEPKQDGVHSWLSNFSSVNQSHLYITYDNEELNHGGLPRPVWENQMEGFRSLESRVENNCHAKNLSGALLNLDTNRGWVR